MIAPSASQEALTIMASKKNLRLVLADFSAMSEGSYYQRETRSILGAFLVQERDRVVEAIPAWSNGVEIAPQTILRVVTKLSLIHI